MTEDLAGNLGEEEEAKEKMQNNTVHLKQRRASAPLMVSELEQENVNRGKKHDLISITQLKIERELYIKSQRSKLMRRKRIIAAKTRHVNQLERLAEMENHNIEEFLKWKEKKSVEMKTLFEEACKSKQEKNAAIEKLNDETRTIKSEVAKIEEILNKYKRYRNIMFHTEAFKAEDEQNQEPQPSVQQGLECEESSPGKAVSSSREAPAHRHTLADSVASSTFLQEKLLSTDPQQLLDLAVELKEQILSLIQNSTRKDETLEELQQVTTVIRTTIEEDEEKLTLPINDTMDRIHTEKERVAKLNLKDFMLNALDVKVTELHRCSVGNQLINFSTMEKLSSVEYHTSILLEQIESLPKESLEMLRQLKDSERMSRLHEAKVRLEREKQIERAKKCMQRSLSDSKKIRGRKLLPRCFPVEQKIKVIVEDNVPSEDEFHAYLFSTEDME
ncbi:hypothetical protein PAMP_006332 [Pampus punctatissimus]